MDIEGIVARLREEASRIENAIQLFWDWAPSLRVEGPFSSRIRHASGLGSALAPHGFCGLRTGAMAQPEPCPEHSKKPEHLCAPAGI